MFRGCQSLEVCCSLLAKHVVRCQVHAIPAPESVRALLYDLPSTKFGEPG
jgi:hypothetical protein